MDTAIRQLVSRAVASEEAIDIFAAAGLKKPDISILSDDFLQEVRQRKIRSIAVPPLGSGLGGLQWGRVKGMITAAFADMPDVRVKLYQPKGSPAAKDMPVGTAKPKMTVARALLIKLMKQYARFAYRLTLPWPAGTIANGACSSRRISGWPGRGFRSRDG